MQLTPLQRAVLGASFEEAETELFRLAHSALGMLPGGGAAPDQAADPSPPIMQGTAPHDDIVAGGGTSLGLAAQELLQQVQGSLADAGHLSASNPAEAASPDASEPQHALELHPPSALPSMAPQQAPCLHVAPLDLGLNLPSSPQKGGALGHSTHSLGSFDPFSYKVPPLHRDGEAVEGSAEQGKHLDNSSYGAFGPLAAAGAV